MIQRPLIWLQSWLRHLRDQKSANHYTAQRKTETEADYRESIPPFTPEEQRPGSKYHKAGADHKDAETAHQRQLVKWTKVLAIVTGTLAFATFIVAGFSGWQIRDARTAAGQQHTDTLTALRKTDDTIAALKAQAKIMRGQLDTMQIDEAIRQTQLRARLIVDLNVVGVTKDGIEVRDAGLEKIEEYHITPHLTNVGATDAINYWGVDDAKGFPPPFPSNLTFGRIDYRRAIATKFTIGPTQAAAANTLSVSVDVARQALDGAGLLLAWGYAEYSDVFPGSAVHHLRWCMRLRPRRAGQWITLSLPEYYRTECNGGD